MPTTLPPLLTHAPMVEAQTLRVSRVWLGWFEQSYLRQGGQEAATNIELAGGVAGNAEHIGQVEGDLAQTSSSLAELEAEVTALQAVVLQQGTDLTALTTRVTTLETQLAAVTMRVTTLETTVAAHGTRLTALEAWKTAVVGGLPAVVSVTAVPALANDPATSILLENDLTANWRPPLNSNDAGLASAVNALRTALAA